MTNKNSGYTNKEFDNLLGIKDYKQTVTNNEPLADEVTFKRNPLIDIPFKRQAARHCVICGGIVIFDLKRKLQWRQCEQCDNVHVFTIKNGGRVHYRFDPNVAPDKRRGVLPIDKMITTKRLYEQPVKARRI